MPFLGEHAHPDLQSADALCPSAAVFFTMPTTPSMASYQTFASSCIENSCLSGAGKERDTIGVTGSVHTNGETWIPAAGEMIASLSPRAADPPRTVCSCVGLPSAERVC